ncbi:MAG: LysR family transcriptional regulator, partial [Gemmatimonadales bacterium]|nr:LysR family transcriptional regulator [Gemmatimonadales bacterium]
FYFYHVARLGSFTTAETVLDIAQPAMSRQIQQLEADLGVQLLERNTRGVTLTEIGTIVYQRAEAILAEMSETHLEIDVAMRRPVGQISMAAPTFFIRASMPRILQRFTAAYPDVRLRIIEASTGHISELLAAGEVDLAIVLQEPRSKTIRSETLVSQHMDLALAVDHPMAQRKSIKREELAGLPFCVAANPHGSRVLIERYFSEGGIKPDIRLEVDSMFLLKIAIKTMSILSFIPQSDLEPGDDLVSVPLDPPLVRTMYLAQLSDREKPLVEPLVSEIRSSFDTPPKARATRRRTRPASPD